MTNSAKLIAIVEDDDVMRRGLKRFFEKEKFKVISFDNGTLAADELELKRPDLIFCDYQLPGASGLEVLRSLRNAGSTIPFVLITGYYSDELSKDALRYGATATLEKPFELSSLRVFFE